MNLDNNIQYYKKAFKIAIAITSALIILCIALPLYSVLAKDTKVKESIAIGNKYINFEGFTFALKDIFS
jgi:hypothetical protein